MKPMDELPKNMEDYLLDDNEEIHYREYLEELERREEEKNGKKNL